MELAKEQFEVTLVRNPKSGKISAEFWKRPDGRLTRPNGPYRTNWDDEGRKTDEAFSVEFFDPDEAGEHPASIRYDPKTGAVTREVYEDLAGNLHRDFGPAVVHYDPETGEVIAQHFYIAGNKIDEDGNLIKNYEDPFMLNI